MEIKSCKYCNRAFGYNGGPVILCSKCDELLWNNVKDYLKEHPNASSKEVSKNLKIKLSIIEDFIADDRLNTIDDESNNAIKFNKCQICGNIINLNEKYCNDCFEKEKKKRLLNEIKELYKEENKRDIIINKNDSSRMFIETNRYGKRR